MSELDGDRLVRGFGQDVLEVGGFQDVGVGGQDPFRHDDVFHPRGLIV